MSRGAGRSTATTSIINYFVLGDQVVMTPGFWGAEPVLADRGKYEGLREFVAEEREGLALIRGLSATQRSQAILYESMLTRTSRRSATRPTTDGSRRLRSRTTW